mmetsp:Transcript_35688/g.60138  ORF Transcript_35688/g.60138 Transcript_35688/m.60138 type:complete len:218 (+) Transcript_35688:870-1523(+)
MEGKRAKGVAFFGQVLAPVRRVEVQLYLFLEFRAVQAREAVGGGLGPKRLEPRARSHAPPPQLPKPPSAQHLRARALLHEQNPKYYLVCTGYLAVCIEALVFYIHLLTGGKQGVPVEGQWLVDMAHGVVQLSLQQATPAASGGVRRRGGRRRGGGGGGGDGGVVQRWCLAEGKEGLEVVHHGHAVVALAGEQGAQFLGGGGIALAGVQSRHLLYHHT